MRVALIGCGQWGAHILRDLRQLGCEVPVVARSPASIARATAGGASAIVGTSDELPPVDGVVVASSTSSHAEVLEGALRLEVPVFVEKPLCDDAGDAARLAAGAGGRLFVMDKWRYHPGVLLLAEIVRSGRLGAVRGLRTVRVGWGSSHNDVDSVWTLVPHDLSIALEIFGRIPAPVAAAAHVDSGGSLVLHGLLEAGEVWHALEASDRAPENERRIVVYGEEGSAELGGGWDEHVSVFGLPTRGEPLVERLPAVGELPLLAELRTFVEHLAGGPAPRSSAAEGLAVVEAIAGLRALAGLP